MFQHSPVNPFRRRTALVRKTPWRYVPKAVRHANGKATQYNGYLYPSMTEAHCRMMLDDKVRRGEYVWIKNQVTIPCLIGKYHPQDYTMDFIACRPGGAIDFWEAKGYEREYWKGRWPFVVAILLNAYPGSRVWIYDTPGKIKRAVVRDASRVNMGMPRFQSA